MSDALHLLALDAEQQPIGTARLLPSGQIGRMAVLGALASARSRPRPAATLAGRGGQGRLSQNLFLHAQLSALPFYEQARISAPRVRSFRRPASHTDA